jgi:hypothetical protein
MSRLLHSSKFWILVLDTLVMITLFFVGKYAAPELAEDINFLIASLQPIFIMLIAGITGEDMAAKRAGMPVRKP